MAAPQLEPASREDGSPATLDGPASKASPLSVAVSLAPPHPTVTPSTDNVSDTSSRDELTSHKDGSERPSVFEGEAPGDNYTYSAVQDHDYSTGHIFRAYGTDLDKSRPLAASFSLFGGDRSLLNSPVIQDQGKKAHSSRYAPLHRESSALQHSEPRDDSPETEIAVSTSTSTALRPSKPDAPVDEKGGVGFDSEPVKRPAPKILKRDVHLAEAKGSPDPREEGPSLAADYSASRSSTFQSHATSGDISARTASRSSTFETDPTSVPNSALCSRRSTLQGPGFSFRAPGPSPNPSLTFSAPGIAKSLRRSLPRRRSTFHSRPGFSSIQAVGRKQLLRSGTDLLGLGSLVATRTGDGLRSDNVEHLINPSAEPTTELLQISRQALQFPLRLRLNEILSRLQDCDREFSSTAKTAGKSNVLKHESDFGATYFPETVPIYVQSAHTKLTLQQNLPSKVIPGRDLYSAWHGSIRQCAGHGNSGGHEHASGYNGAGGIGGPSQSQRPSNGRDSGNRHFNQGDQNEDSQRGPPDGDDPGEPCSSSDREKFTCVFLHERLVTIDKRDKTKAKCPAKKDSPSKLANHHRTHLFYYCINCMTAFQDQPLADKHACHPLCLELGCRNYGQRTEDQHFPCGHRKTRNSNRAKYNALCRLARLRFGPQAGPKGETTVFEAERRSQQLEPMPSAEDRSLEDSATSMANAGSAIAIEQGKGTDALTAQVRRYLQKLEEMSRDPRLRSQIDIQAVSTCSMVQALSNNLDAILRSYERDSYEPMWQTQRDHPELPSILGADSSSVPMLATQSGYPRIHPPAGFQCTQEQLLQAPELPLVGSSQTPCQQPTRHVPSSMPHGLPNSSQMIAYHQNQAHHNYTNQDPGLMSTGYDSFGVSLFNPVQDSTDRAQRPQPRPIELQGTGRQQIEQQQLAHTEHEMQWERSLDDGAMMNQPQMGNLNRSQMGEQLPEVARDDHVLEALKRWYSSNNIIPCNQSLFAQNPDDPNMYAQASNDDASQQGPFQHEDQSQSTSHNPGRPASYQGKGKGKDYQYHGG